MPIALVLAETEEQARHAAKLIKAEIEPLEIITDAREAQAKGELISPPKHFKLGDADKAFATCEYVFEGRADVNGQEHLYIETQGAYAIPTEAERFENLFFDAGTDRRSARRFARDGDSDASVWKLT